MILEAEHLLRDSATDTIYTKLTSTAFGIGQGGYGGPRGPTKPLYPPPDRQPDAVHVFQTTPEHALLYRLCGDYNPMHADDEFGKRAGFKGAILQGLGTWNIAAHGVLMEMGASDPLKFHSFKARFANVVYPGIISKPGTKCLRGADLKSGDCLETRIWKAGTKDGMDEIIFQTIVQSDQRVALSVVVLACRLLSIP